MRQWKQQNDIFGAVGAGTVDNGYAMVEVMTDGGRVWGLRLGGGQRNRRSHHDSGRDPVTRGPNQHNPRPEAITVSGRFSLVRRGV